VDKTSQAAIQSACHQAMNLYLIAVDLKDIDLMLQAFDPHAVWLRPGMAEMKGHLEIRSFFEAIFRKHADLSAHGHLTRHCLTTFCVIPTVEAKRASSIAYAIVYREPAFSGRLPVSMAEPELLVEYRDIFVESEDEWRILEHEARHIFRSPSWGQQLSPKELAALNLKDAKEM
jgi:hypothetical protein